MGKDKPKQSTEFKFRAKPRPERTPSDSYTVEGKGKLYIFYSKPIETELPSEMDFAVELRKAIKECGVSQSKLAKFAGVPQPAISNFMNGNDIKLQTFNRLASVLGFELKHKRSKLPKTVLGD